MKLIWQTQLCSTIFSVVNADFHYVKDLFGKKHGMAMEVDAGEWVYPFEFELPSNIPYSTEGKFGEIYYGVQPH